MACGSGLSEGLLMHEFMTVILPCAPPPNWRADVRTWTSAQRVIMLVVTVPDRDC